MPSCFIQRVETRDARFVLPEGAGTDAVHSNPEYAFAVTLLRSDRGYCGTGIVLTLGAGNRLVCDAIELLSGGLAGSEIEELMADFGAVARRMADHPQLRWLGPQKGVVHLALASLTNACFDLWAKARGVPLWRLLVDLTPEELLALLDLHALEDFLPRAKAIELVRENWPGRAARAAILEKGYPGYNTSVGWFQYGDEQVRQRTREALGRGFHAFKLKVGSPDGERDIRRAAMLRELAGAQATLMLDVNQQWTPAQAVRMCSALAPLGPYWIEEPMHADDIEAHRQLAHAIAPMRIALGEQVPNPVVFKNFMQAGAVHFVQPDCTRLAGVSEFLTVSLMARACGLPVAPHVGDMGQIHQHLVLFNHIALGHEVLFLEYIPHLREYFVHPATVEDGVYWTPQEPGSSSDLRNAI